MDKRFSNLFNLTEAQAIALLDAPADPNSGGNSRYTAAAHLANCPTEAAIQALMRAIQVTDPALDNRIVRRKAVESLGRLQASTALPLIRTCLGDSDCYMVENAVWAIGEVGTADPSILEEIAQLLDRPQQTYRVIIHTLAKLGYGAAVDRIRPFMTDEQPPIASAAIAAVCRFTGDYTQMEQVVAMLQHASVVTRRLAIQDLIDAQYFAAIPAIAKCPVSLVFRLRGIRQLSHAGLASGQLSFAEIQPSLEQTLYDHPQQLNLVHQYEQPPDLEALIRELYDTDFGRCYLATHTLLAQHADTAPAALFATYDAEAKNDYGAHFHVMKLFGWLRHGPAYDLLIEALNNTLPQFQKSRAAAALALSELGNPAAIPALQACLDTKIWDLKYAILMALDQLGDVSGYEQVTPDDDVLIQAKAQMVLAVSAS